MEFLAILNIIISTTVTILFSYKFLLGALGLFKTRKFPDAKEDHTYAFLIAGRNEENVIGNLIESIKLLDYDQSKLKIFFVADNCTDSTAKVARAAGEMKGAETYVFERFNKDQIGKGYALDFLLSSIRKALPDYNPEAFFIFDADNLLDKDYVKEMNKVFDSGYKISTSYRNAKNFDTNWISATTAMNFLAECRFVHAPRSVLNTSTYVSGTGFMVSSEVMQIDKGWKYTTLTEDIEFSTSSLIKGYNCTYCDKAIFYDEQPNTLRASWNQRLRWTKGFYQCFWGYFLSLLLTLFSKNIFAKYELMIMLFPFAPLTFFWNVFYTITSNIYSLTSGVGNEWIQGMLSALLFTVISYLLFAFAGGVVMFTERKRTKVKFWKGVYFSFTFPLFIFLYVPLSVVAVFKKVKWKHIPHVDSRKIEDIK